MADFVRYAASFGLDLYPTNKKMVRKENLYREVKPGQHLAVLIGKDSKNPRKANSWHLRRQGRWEINVYHMTGKEKKDHCAELRKG